MSRTVSDGVNSWTHPDDCKQSPGRCSICRPLASPYVEKYCRHCGEPLVKMMTRTTYDTSDGHTIIWFDWVCPQYNKWNPFNWHTR